MAYLEKIICLEESATGDGDGVFVLGDCTQQAEALYRAGQQADLVYMDPPFFTGNKFQIRQRVGTRGYRGDASQVLLLENDFDRFETKQAYLDMLRNVIEMSHELLNDHGSFYLHVDYRAAAHARLFADEIFGERNFLNEIIWSYKSGGWARNNYARKHDTILFYKKNKQPYFNTADIGVPREKLRDNNLKRGVDEDGRAYSAIRTNGKEYRYYDDATVPPSDVWSDISHLQQRDPERTGYPTQKPMALMERIIRASCPEEGKVVDLFMGSGTTAAAAAKWNRNWVGADNCQQSLVHTRKRVMEQGGAYSAKLPARISPGELSVVVVRGMRECSVMLQGFEIPGYDNPFVDDMPQTEQVSLESPFLRVGMTASTPGYAGGRSLMLLDHWSAGFVVGEQYVALKHHSRTAKTPALGDSITIADKDLFEADGIPCIHTVDIFGNSVFFLLRY